MDEDTDCCLSCGEEIFAEEDRYPDLTTPLLDEDDCLCLDCAIAHALEAMRELQSEIEGICEQSFEWIIRSKKDAGQG